MCTSHRMCPVSDPLNQLRVCQELIQGILKEADILGGGLPPNQVVPMPEPPGKHTRTQQSGRCGGAT